MVFDTHFPNAASNNWNFDIQRELRGNNVIDVAYVGAMGVHVYGERDGNPPDPALVAQLVAFCSNPNNSFVNEFGQIHQTGDGSSTSLYAAVGNPDSAFGDLPFNAVNNNALLQPDYQIDEFNSIYHGLQTKFVHRMSHGLQFQAAYTWSHALDNASDPLRRLSDRTCSRGTPGIWHKTTVIPTTTPGRSRCSTISMNCLLAMAKAT